LIHYEALLVAAAVVVVVLQAWLFHSLLEYRSFPLLEWFRYSQGSNSMNIRCGGGIPDITHVGQSKVKLAKVTRGILLGLPVRLLVFLAKFALVHIPNLCDKTVVYLPRFKTAFEVYRGDLLGLENTAQYVLAHPISKYYEEPVGGKVAAATCFADFVMELHWVAFEVGWGLFPRSIVATTS
jgi:hypothetical protein